MIITGVNAERRPAVKSVSMESVRSYEVIEIDIITNMKRVFVLEKELSEMKKEADNKSKQINVEKTSGNPIGRIFLPSKIENLHNFLSKVEIKEAEINALKSNIEKMAIEADEAIRRENLSEEVKNRLEIASRRKLNRLEALIDEELSKPGVSSGERTNIDKLRKEIETAQKEFNEFYGIH